MLRDTGCLEILRCLGTLFKDTEMLRDTGCLGILRCLGTLAV